MTRLRKNSNSGGFFKPDFLAVLVVLVIAFMLIAAAILPQTAGSKRPVRSRCAANLKQVALGYLLWVNDSEGQNLPFCVPVAKGGLKDPSTNKIHLSSFGDFDPGLRTNAWFQFLFINKELGDPKVLVSPDDKERKPATSWGNQPQGLASPTMQNNGVSYVINLDASGGTGSIDLKSAQSSVLLSERHMENNGMDSHCASGIGPVNFIKTQQGAQINGSPFSVGWKEANPKIHYKGGDIALLDGSTHQVNASQLQQLLNQEPSDNGGLHFIYP